jgi:hypothetical protein
MRTGLGRSTITPIGTIVEEFGRVKGAERPDRTRTNVTRSHQSADRNEHADRPGDGPKYYSAAFLSPSLA